MAKPPFTRDKATPQQQMALDRIEAIVNTLDDTEAQLWEVVDDAQKRLGIPVDFLKTIHKRSRMTMYRRRRERSGSADGATGSAD